MSWQPQQTPQVQAQAVQPTHYSCDQCGAKQTAENIHSHIVGVYHWNKESGYQGVSVTEVDTQMYGCTNQHSKDNGHHMIDAEIPDMSKVPYVDMPLPPLPNRCSLIGCGRVLDTDWWQVAPTYAARGSQGLEAHAYWDLPNFNGAQCWFCTLDHAVIGGHVLLEKLDELGFEEQEPIPANIAPARRIVGPKSL